MRRFLIGCAAAATVGVSAVAAGPVDVPGAVYTATNGSAANEVLVFDRAADGTLSYRSAVATGGTGTGMGLGNQGGLRLTRGGQFVVVVNAASDDVSVLRVTNAGLALVDVEPSGGLRPVSVAVDGRLVYVLNNGGAVGGADGIAGFHLSPAGDLSPIPGAMAALSGPSVGPAQIEFSPDGNFLVVTEKGTNLIDVFTLASDGTVASAASYASVGATPFGFEFGHRNQFFVSEAFGGAVDASAVSSYALDVAGMPGVISPSVGTTETAACWIVVSTSGQYLYTTNAGSGSISGYRIRPDGTITLIDANGVTGATGAGSTPIDLAFSVNDQFLYSLNAGNGTISAFRVGPRGGLMTVGTTFNLPAGTNGLAAW